MSLKPLDRVPRHGPLKLPYFDGIEVLPLSDHEWRISDPELARREGLGLLGFVERVGDNDFEVMRLGSPLDRTHFGLMEEAVAFLKSPATR